MSEDITPGATSLEGGTAPADNPAADTPTPADSPAPEGGAPTSQPTDWRTGFPEAWGEKLKDVESADDALKALERGLSYTPALKPEDVELKYPDGMQVDEGVRDNFRQFCVDKGITPAQAQALLDWQLAANREIADAVMARGKAELQKLWGSRFEENSAMALKAVVNLDRRMGGKLSEALAFSGMNNNPVLVEAFHHIGTLISADALSGGKAAPAQDKAETAEETYNGMFK
ncbi:hypothetical protein [uncultured Desulfovibrio sp.]|uniref:hypothetical protein n=1 Tax=uncultured Desulfovibrio sp. TaxID=167968 RepID=UPI0027120441|nr:hypothetical protein [uncultured Desulfovibrio sp.]